MRIFNEIRKYKFAYGHKFHRHTKKIKKIPLNDKAKKNQ